MRTWLDIKKTPAKMLPRAACRDHKTRQTQPAAMQAAWRSANVRRIMNLIFINVWSNFKMKESNASIVIGVAER